MKFVLKNVFFIMFVFCAISFGATEQIAVQSYTATPAADIGVPDASGTELTDGNFPPANMYDVGWSDYNLASNNEEIVFTFASTSDVGAIEIYYRVNSDPYWNCVAPSNITYSFSNDGITFSNPITKSSGFITFDGTAKVAVTIPGGLVCKYVKAVISAPGWLRLGEFTFFKRVIRPISYVADPAPEAGTPDTGGDELVDGVLPTDWYSDSWVGWYIPSSDLVVTFDMNVPHELSSIGLHYMVYSGWSLESPTAVTFTFSNDGVNFGNPVTYSTFDNSEGVHTTYIDVLGSVSRYVKATITGGVSGYGWLRLGEVAFADKGEVVYTAVPAANSTAPDDGGELVDGLAPVGDVWNNGWSNYLVPDGNLVITFNLNDSVVLSSINLSYMVYDAWTSYAPDSVTYSFSNDGVTFSNPVTITGLDNSNWEHTEAANIPGGITAKYVKAELALNSLGDWIRLSEFTFVERGEVSYTTSVTPVWFTPDNNHNLANGILPTDPYNVDWVKYNTEILQVNFNLNDTVTLSDVGIHYYVLSGWNQKPPSSVTLTFSTDGINFANPVVWSTFDSSNGAHTTKISVPNVTCQYVKAVVTAPSTSLWHCLGEFLFYESGTNYNNVPTAVAAGLVTFDDNPYDTMVVFDHPVDVVSATNLDNYDMPGNLISDAEVWSKASNCVKISVAIPLASGVSHSLKYKNIEGLAGDKITYWRQTNSFAQTSITASAGKLLIKQLPDGAYNTVPPINGVSFQSGDNNIWIVPSFGNLAAQAMLMANEVSPDPCYLASVNLYLHWYVNHLETDGTIYNYTGTYPSYNKTSDRDSTDAYAAQFIETAYMYYQATNDSAFLNWVWPYVIQVVGAMDLTLQSDGLTYAKPTVPVKGLMDNTDVYIGYKAAAELAALKSDTARQSAWSTKANNSLAGLETMYLGDSLGRYAIAKSSSGLVTDWINVNPDGDSQMFAIRNVLMETNTDRALKVWNASIQQFVPNHVPNENLSSVWWVLGGFGAGEGDEAETEVCFIASQKGMASWASYIFVDYQSIMVMHNRAMQQQIGDFNIDGRIDFEDFAIFAAQWLDGKDFGDLANFVEKWLAIEIWWN